MIRVVLGLGSNKRFNGMSCLEILDKACIELKEILIKPSFSSVYKTKAMYVENQDDFYNMAAIGFVPDDLTPHSLLKKVNEIENKYGRNREEEVRYGPRSLDIDIELFGNSLIRDADLEIPHNKIKERAFVLVPLLEIFLNPADKEKRNFYIECLSKLDASEIIKLGFLEDILNEKAVKDGAVYSSK